MKLLRAPGATSEIWQVFIQDTTSTTGGGLTGLTNASAGLIAYFHRDTDVAATVIALVSMTVGTFTSGGFKEIDSIHMPGWYQFCPPNAAFLAGAKSCGFHLQGAANMAPLPIEVDLNASLGTGSIARATFSIDSGEQNIRANTAQAGTLTTITLDAGASGVNNFYNNDIIYITSGTGVGQGRFILGYVGATKVATVAAWAINPDVTSTFAILPFDAVAGASVPTVAQIANGVWSIDMSTISRPGGSTRYPLQGVDAIRNKMDATSGTMEVVYQQDDLTISFSQPLLSDPNAKPIVKVGT